MARRGVPAGWDSPGDRPSILQITVESTPRQRPPVRRVHVLVAIVVLAAIAAWVVVAVLPRGGGGSRLPPASGPQPPAPQQPSVLVQSLVDSGPPPATAPQLYRFPVGCVYSKVTAVERNRTGPCSPHAGYVTAVVRRTGGVWRVTLEPTNPSCVPVPVPPLARGRAKACRR